MERAETRSLNAIVGETEPEPEIAGKRRLAVLELVLFLAAYLYLAANSG